MKKKVLLIFILISVITLTGCFSKESINTKKFADVIEEHGYTTTDVTNQFKDSTFIKEATIAQSTEGWQIEFYIIEDDNYAMSMFEKNKLTFDNEKEKSSIYKNINGKNYNTYSLSTNNKYMYLSRINNTLIYVNEELEYKNKISELIKSLGY